jgi:hypothetical protein
VKLLKTLSTAGSRTEILDLGIGLQIFFFFFFFFFNGHFCEEYKLNYLFSIYFVVKCLIAEVYTVLLYQHVMSQSFKLKVMNRKSSDD